jgi:hypothetical protein
MVTYHGKDDVGADDDDEDIQAQMYTNLNFVQMRYS